MEKLYPYKCEECGHSEDFAYKMEDERPGRKNCSNCGKENTMYRIFGSAVVIPDHMRATDISFDYSKKATGKKLF